MAARPRLSQLLGWHPAPPARPASALQTSAMGRGRRSGGFCSLVAAKDRLGPFPRKGKARTKGEKTAKKVTCRGTVSEIGVWVRYLSSSHRFSSPRELFGVHEAGGFATGLKAGKRKTPKESENPKRGSSPWFATGAASLKQGEGERVAYRAGQSVRKEEKITSERGS